MSESEENRTSVKIFSSTREQLELEKIRLRKLFSLTPQQAPDYADIIAAAMKLYFSKSGERLLDQKFSIRK